MDFCYVFPITLEVSESGWVSRRDMVLAIRALLWISIFLVPNPPCVLGCVMVYQLFR